jgi:nucleotide-binding universal stress UspA family protein
MTAFKRILVPTDYGPAAQRAADVACELAEQFRSRLTLLHVWEVPLPAYAEGITLPLEEMRAAAAESLEIEASRIRARFPELETLLLPGIAWRAIEETIREHAFDLVVIGTHGRRGLARTFLGSVAERVVRVATVPVLTVHEEESLNKGD